MQNKQHRALKLGLLIATFFCFSMNILAQPKIKKTRILFLLDASSSMTYNWNPEYSRFGVASNILLKIIDSVYVVNNEIEFAVRAYGTQYPAQLKNCTDTRLEVPFNIQNGNQIKTRLKYLEPLGSSPIAYSLKQAAEGELGDANNYDYSVIFITDGGESCNGDICKTFQELLLNKIKIKPYIIGLDKNESIKSYYDCLGNYIEVTTAEDIDKAVKMIVDANRSIIEKPKQLNLITKMTETPKIIDSVKIVNIPKKDSVVTKVLVDTPVLKKEKGEYSKMILVKSLLKNEVASLRPYKKMRHDVTKLVLHFTLDEKPKLVEVVKLDTPKLKRVTEVFPTIKNQKYPYVSTRSKSKITGDSKFEIKKQKISIRFDVEAPKPILVRVSDVFPKMRSINFPLNIGRSIVEIQVKKTNVKMPTKASLRFEYEEPIKRVTSVFPKLKSIDAPLLVTTKSKLKAKTNSFAKIKKAVLHFEMDMPKKDSLIFIHASNYPRRYSYAYRLPSTKPQPLKRGKAILHFEVAETKITKKDTVAKKPVAIVNNNNLEFTTETSDNAETLVQVYFKGANGKTYVNAKPEIQIRDIVKNAIITSFKRDVSKGEPVPVKAVEGTYNFVVTGYSDLQANNVKILPNKLNKVFIRVSDGTLQFAYTGNRNRPIEYNAIVNRRFAAGATILQKCTDKLYYEPGNYYVEINTLPAQKFSIDLTFGAVYEIQIAQPGSLQIVNSAALGKVQLQQVLGDDYITFYVMNVTGNLNDQKLVMQPGPYKAIFPIDPKMPMAGTKVIDFRINSNENTDLDLK